MNKIFLTLSIITILFSVENNKDGILFTYEDKNAKSVFLVGSMNNWNPAAHPMNKDDKGIWKINLQLDSGKHTYKFIIDGNWYYDQENPFVEDDGYGGSNSVIEIDSNGGLIKNTELSLDGSKSTYNPKIYFKGRYYNKNLFNKNEIDRFMLDKPEHDLNFGIKVKFNSNLEGYTILNINNVQEGSEMWKTHFNYKRTYLNLNADYFNITVFDNYGLFTFDDPLHIIGDIGYNGYDFGYEYSGIYAETSHLLTNKISSLLPFTLNGQLLLSDRVGYNEDDISAMRIKLSLPISNDEKLFIGSSNYTYRTKPLEEMIQNHNNYAVDVIYVKDIYKSGWIDKMRLELSSEYSKFNNSNEDSIKSDWMKGENIYLGIVLKLPAALRVYTNYMKSSFELGSSFSRDRYVLGSDFQINNFEWKLSAHFWNNFLSDSLSWKDYYKYAEKTDSNGRWFQQYTEVPFEKYTILGYKTGFLWKSYIAYKFNIKEYKVETILKNKFAQHSFLNKPKYIENILILAFHITPSWQFKIDSRIPYYNDPFLDIKTDFSKNKDVFVSHYFQISYIISNNIWLALGYGINPKVMNSLSDEFYDRGREDYLDYSGELPIHLESYYGGLGERIRLAETSLMNNRSILLHALMEF